MPEVGTVNGELVVGVKLGLQRVAAGPGVGAAGFQHVHAVVDGRAGKGAEHVFAGWRAVIVGVGSEDDIPSVGNVMEFLWSFVSS